MAGADLNEEHAHLVAEGIGLFHVASDGGLTEIHQARDQGMDLELPTLTSYPNPVRSALGESWDELRRGNWREGFDGACIVLETEIRAYVLRHMQHGRLTFVRSSGVVYAPTTSRLNARPWVSWLASSQRSPTPITETPYFTAS